MTCPKSCCDFVTRLSIPHVQPRYIFMMLFSIYIQDIHSSSKCLYKCTGRLQIHAVPEAQFFMPTILCMDCVDTPTPTATHTLLLPFPSSLSSGFMFSTLNMQSKTQCLKHSSELGCTCLQYINHSLQFEVSLGLGLGEKGD